MSSIQRRRRALSPPPPPRCRMFVTTVHERAQATMSSSVAQSVGGSLCRSVPVVTGELKQLWQWHPLAEALALARSDGLPPAFPLPSFPPPLTRSRHRSSSFCSRCYVRMDGWMVGRSVGGLDGWMDGWHSWQRRRRRQRRRWELLCTSAYNASNGGAPSPLLPTTDRPGVARLLHCFNCSRAGGGGMNDDGMTTITRATSSPLPSLHFSYHPPHSFT